MGFHLRTTSKRRSTPFLPACTASTAIIRPDACSKSCVPPSRWINLILGIRTHITRGPTSGFALSLGYRQIQTGGRSWTTGTGYAGEVLEFDVFKVAREGFICLLECFHSGATQTSPRCPRCVTGESQRSPQCICTRTSRPMLITPGTGLFPSS